MGIAYSEVKGAVVPYAGGWVRRIDGGQGMNTQALMIDSGSTTELIDPDLRRLGNASHCLHHTLSQLGINGEQVSPMR